MTTIADCTEGEIITIPHGRFIVEKVEETTGLFNAPNKRVTLRRVDDDGLLLNGKGDTLVFQGADDMVMR